MLLAIAAILLLVGWASSVIPLSGEVCDPPERGHEQKCLTHFLPVATALWVIHFLNHNEGAVLGLATIAIAWFTHSLRRSTDKLWTSGEKQIGVAVRSAAAAERSAAIAETSLLKLERAMVFAEALTKSMHFSAPGTLISWDFTVQWRNSGRSAGRNFVDHTNLTIRDTELPADFDFSDIEEEAAPSFIGPLSSMSSLPVSVDVPSATLIRDGKRFCYIWGSCEYDDIFDGTPRHRSEFAYQITFSGDLSPERTTVSLRPLAKHNGADEGCMKQPKERKT